MSARWTDITWWYVGHCHPYCHQIHFCVRTVFQTIAEYDTVNVRPGALSGLHSSWCDSLWPEAWAVLHRPAGRGDGWPINADFELSYLIEVSMSVGWTVCQWTVTDIGRFGQTTYPWYSRRRPWSKLGGIWWHFFVGLYVGESVENWDRIGTQEDMDMRTY